MSQINEDVAKLLRLAFASADPGSGMLEVKKYASGKKFCGDGEAIVETEAFLNNYFLCYKNGNQKLADCHRWQL